MKKLLVISVVSIGLALGMSFVNATNAEIKFKSMSFADAKKEASDSKKIIFIDVHTSWCGPCKQMAKTTFKDKDVASLFNKKFINLKIDAESDSDGPGISKTYGVKAYPTLLFISPDGKVKKKLVGAQSSEKLISIAKGL